MKITHDLHIHTTLSLCAKPTAIAEDYIRETVNNGIETIGFADHLWDERIPTPCPWYEKQNMTGILALKERMKNTDTGSVRVLVGAEAEYDLANHDISITPESAAKLDFLIVPNSHTHITMPKEYYDDKKRHVKYMLDAWFDIMNSKASEYITAVAHPFYAVCCPHDNRELFPLITDADFKECFDAAREKGIAVEINSSCAAPVSRSLGSIVNDPALRMYEIAKQCGCKFTFGSDAHSIGGINGIERAYTICALCGIGKEDILEI